MNCNKNTYNIIHNKKTIEFVLQFMYLFFRGMIVFS